MEYSPPRRGPTRLSGSPAQTSLSSLISWPINVTQRSNHTFSPFRNPLCPGPAHFSYLWPVGLTLELARPLQTRFVRIENRCHLSADAYNLNQLRYDLRKLKGHGLTERDGARYAFRLTHKGVQVALLMLFFHKRLCGPLANSRFHHRPDAQHRPDSRLELAYHRADKAIENIVDLLAAA